jgi:S1/P1 Nuclease
MHQMTKLALSTALLLLSAATPALAWDDFGHMEVAATAYKALTPKTKKRVAALLRLNPRYANWIVGARAKDVDRVAFLRAATWADAIKSDPKYDKNTKDPQSAPTAAQNIGYADHFAHGYWHYINVPLAVDATPTVPALAPNVITQIATFRAALSDASLTDETKSYDLVWLLHLVGDVHQPLHCVARFDHDLPQGDEGGNKVQVAGNAQPPICEDPRYCPFDPPSELHAFVDTIAGSGYGVGPVEVAVAKLPKADPKLAAIADEKVWLEEGVELAQTNLYIPPIGAGPGPFTLDASYQKSTSELGAKRIALAGARLAKLLNTAFAN